MKHLPFESLYRADYEVVEERQGNVRLFPHTAQLPIIYRAIHHEFHSGLPPRISRLDQRGSGFDKIVRKNATLLFCSVINVARRDELRLFSILDRNLVAQPAVVQHITEDTPRGAAHRFRLYAGEQFVVELYLCGRRVAFADHVLERFSSRTANHVGEDLSMFLMTFFGSPIIAMPVGPGRAFVVDFQGSILAFPYREVGGEYFVTTCLTINEISSLHPEFPAHGINVHYDLPFHRPVVRNWMPVEWLLKFYRAWERKVPPPPLRQRARDRYNWHEIAWWSRDAQKKAGHGEGSRLVFMDDIPGPMSLDVLPTHQVFRMEEIEAYKQTHPDYDWEWIIAERVEEGTFAPPLFPVPNHHLPPPPQPHRKGRAKRPPRFILRPEDNSQNVRLSSTSPP